MNSRRSLLVAALGFALLDTRGKPAPSEVRQLHVTDRRLKIMRHRLVVGSLAATLGFISTAFADVIELKTGQRVEGTLKQATSASVSLEVGGQTITFEGDKVRAIYFGSAPTVTVTTEPSGVAAAISALKDLRSVTRAGVTYRDYVTRVGDAKIKVDRGLANAPDGPTRDGVANAMELYVLAGTAWENQISNSRYSPSVVFLVGGGSLRRLGSHPLVRACNAMQPLVEGTRERLRKPGGLKEGAIDHLTPEKTDDLLGVAATQPGGTAALWSCAADQFVEAEKLLGATK